MVFNVILLLFVNHSKDFFVIYRLPDDWYYPWNHGRTYDLSLDFFSTIIYIYIYIYINTELLDGNQGHQEETHRPTHRFRRLFLDLLSMGWRGCASAMGAIKLPPSCVFIFFYLCLNQQLSKQWRRWWFETPSHTLWRHLNVDDRVCNTHMKIFVF